PLRRRARHRPNPSRKAAVNLVTMARRVFFLAAALVALTCACAKRVAPAPNATAAPPAGSATLEPRVQAYWARRQAKGPAGAYEVYCPAYRSRVTPEQFPQLTRLSRFDPMGARV